MMRRLSVTVWVAAVLLASCGGGAPAATTEPAGDSAPATAGVAGIGDTLTVNGLSFTLTGVRTSGGDGFFTPLPGTKWIVIDGTWRNDRPEAERLYELMQFELRVEGRRVNPQYTPDLTGTLGGTVMPGGTLSGDFAWEVPAAATEAELLVRFDQTSAPGRFVLALPPAPEPPAPEATDPAPAGTTTVP